MSFVVFEGCDASGKATQSKRFFARLNEPKALLSFPHYETPTGKAILRHLKGEIHVSQTKEPFFSTAPEDALVFQCMMLADKAQIAPDIRRWQAQGSHVVSDRYWPSAYAYGKTDAIDTSWLIQINSFLPVPDDIVILDIPPELAVERVQKRAADTGRTVDRFETLERQKSVRENYLELVERMRGQFYSRWHIIDGSRREDVVCDDIWNTLLGQASDREP